MPAATITAMCPYCRVGGVRAPDTAVGLSATCPSCHSSFTVTPPDAPPGRAAPETTAARPLPTEPARPLAAPAAEAEHRPDRGFAAALIALAVTGLGVTAAVFPHGGYVTIAAAWFGLLVGLGSLLFAQRPGVPGLAAGFGGAVLAVALAAPGWLGLPAWRSAEGRKPVVVQAVGRDGAPAVAADWIDAAAAAWQRDDVRVTVTAVRVGPVEVAGAKGPRRQTRESALQIRVRVANEGAARMFEFTGWSPAADAVRLTAGDRPVPPRRFDATLRPDPPPLPARLFPGQSAADVLYFEPPPAGPDPLRLELPGAAVGSPDPVRFTIPRSMIPSR